MLLHALRRGPKRALRLSSTRGPLGSADAASMLPSTHVTHRCQAALPALREASDSEDEQAPLIWLPAAEGSPMPEAAHNPRLAQRAAAAAAAAQPAPASRLEALRVRLKAEQGVRRRDAAWLPSPEEVAERLRSGGGCSTSAPTRTPVVQDAELDWRAVVAAARAAQAHVTGEQMLTDTYHRKHTYLRISLTERCNLRCLYCMPEEGVELTPHAGLLSSDEVVRLASLFVRAGVDKIRLTGGEPTLRSDLVPLTARLAALPGLKALGITSNGLTLARQLPALHAAGLTHVNISLDTLRPERFEAMTRRRGHERVLRAIDTALELGYAPVKVNVVVMRGVNDDELADFVELTRARPVNVRFIEYMPFDGNVWSDAKMVRYSEMLNRIRAVLPAGLGLERCADPKGEVAKNYAVPGYAGQVSFVTSMTSAFCSDCNRLRVMADGNLKVCLFGANEVSLRAALREGASDADLAAVVSAAVDRKKPAHAGMFELAAAKNRAMVKIGG